MKKEGPVLIVDDSPGVRMLTRTILTGLGCQVVEAGNGMEGLQKITSMLEAKNLPILVLADLFMPQMNGIDFIRQMRRHPECQHIPVWMLTTESRTDLREEGKSAGANGWIVKPIDSERFATLVKRFLTGETNQKSTVMTTVADKKKWGDIPPEAMTQFKEDFAEHLEEMEEVLLRIEENSGGTVSEWHQLFRAIHSIKGESDLFGFAAIANRAHELEELLLLLAKANSTLLCKNIGLAIRVHDWMARVIRDESILNEGELLGLAMKEAVHEINNPNTPEVANISEGGDTEPLVSSRNPDGKLKILIADDELNNRILMRKLVGDLGECDMVFNGQETVEAFEAAWAEGVPYDVILLDIMMPVMDGQAALKEIRKLERSMKIAPKEEVVIIMVTALDSPKVVLEAFYRGGCTDYLTKPVDRLKLIEKIREYGLIE